MFPALALLVAICETRDVLPVSTCIRRRAGIAAKDRVAAYVAIPVVLGQVVRSYSVAPLVATAGAREISGHPRLGPSRGRLLVRGLETEATGSIR